MAGTVLWSYAAGGGRGVGPRGQTLVMATLALVLLVQTLATLSGTDAWRARRSMTLTFWASIAGGLGLQALALYWPPLSSILLTEALSGRDLLRVLGMSLLALVVVEVGKAVGRSRAT